MLPGYTLADRRICAGLKGADVFAGTVVLPVGQTVKLLFIVIIGGISTVEGPILGAVIFVFLQQFLSEYVGYNLIILGVITITVIFFAPRGIMGTFQEKVGIEFLPVRRQ